MTFAFQILISSAIFCVLVLVVLGIQKKGFLKHKAVTILLVIVTSLFFCASLFFCYSEFTAYEVRKQQYAQGEKGALDIKGNSSSKKEELDAYQYFKTYQNSLKGYEFFLINMGRNGHQHVSYIYDLRDKIIEQFESEEYSQEYWNKVFSIAFQQEDSTKTYLKSNYEVTSIIPPDDIYTELDGDFGDLNDAENFSYFERLCNLIYIEDEIKNPENRSAARIETLWQYNKAFIYTFFSKSKYDQLCKQLVNDLITVHDRIVAQPNYKAFYEAYDVSDDVFLDFPSKKFTSSFQFSWPFSFWDRRFSENNSEQVYNILKELQDHYSN